MWGEKARGKQEWRRRRVTQTQILVLQTVLLLMSGEMMIRDNIDNLLSRFLPLSRFVPAVLIFVNFALGTRPSKNIVLPSNYNSSP